MNVDRTELRSAALQAVFMNDHDGVTAALLQLDQLELKGLYEDAIKLASWVEGVLETEVASPQFTTPRDEPTFSAPLLTYGGLARQREVPEVPGVELDQLFQTGP